MHFRENKDEYDIVLDLIREGINLDLTKPLGGRMEKHRGNGKMSVINYMNSRIVNSCRKETFVYV